MKRLLVLLPALILAAPPQAPAQSFSQLSDSITAEALPVPEPAAAPEAVEDPASAPVDVDFLVRPDAEHEPGAELFTPWSLGDKSAGGSSAIPYLALARAEAKAQGVDLALVLAIIQKESSFDPKARSTKGARGLMQVMPETAKWLGLKDLRQLNRPDVNLKYGIKYLKYLWNEFAEIAAADISVTDIGKKASQMAIAAYNSGQGNVRKYNGIPPFKETRNYVTKVTQHFLYYEDLLLKLAAEVS